MGNKTGLDGLRSLIEFNLTSAPHVTITLELLKALADADGVPPGGLAVTIAAENHWHLTRGESDLVGATWSFAPVNFTGKLCEEASPHSKGSFIACSRTPCAGVVYHGREGKSYYMCEFCVSHNTRNRGGVLLAFNPNL